MSRRLLLVEPSTTMRHVLEKHLRALGHEVESTDSYSAALDTLRRQYLAFESDITGVIYGWPSVSDETADRLLAKLESEDFSDIPVLVMSTDMRAETRAWVAERDRTAVLPWKDYLGVEGLLERLLDTDLDPVDERVVKFDNTDIHVLVVDDSRSIRYSLRDLFEQHGYLVSLASNGEDALKAARSNSFDVAVLDFYLEETTGDALCRELVSDPECGQVVCAILTGTYADHIIKRSLKAGAVECMFKNESSELLLTRVEAIAHFVRQRRELAVEYERLERTVEALAGAVLIVDAESRVRHASAPALDLLGLSDPQSVVGQSAQALLGVQRLPDVDAAAETMTWRAANDIQVTVLATRSRLPRGNETVVRLAAGVAQSSASADAVPKACDLPASAGSDAPARARLRVVPSSGNVVPIIATSAAEAESPSAATSLPSHEGTEQGGTEPSGAEASGTEPSGAGPSGTGPSGAGPSGTGPSGAEPGSTEKGSVDKAVAREDDAGRQGVSAESSARAVVDAPSATPHDAGLTSAIGSYLDERHSDPVSEELALTDTVPMDDASVRASAAVLAQFNLPASALHFVEQLQRHHSAVGTRPDHVSLLLLGAYVRFDADAHQPVDANLARSVEAGLARLYRRPYHVAALGGHRFGLLIRHAEIPQSYLLTRRLMQLCDVSLIAEGGPTLACTGCLTALANHPERSASDVFALALQGLNVVDQRGVDQAILLDLRRMLAVYPQPSEESPGV